MTSRIFHEYIKVGNVGIIANFVFSYICSFLLYLHQPMLVNVKLEAKDYISRLHTLLDLLIFNGTAKMKLTMLEFLCCGELVKNCSIQ